MKFPYAQPALPRTCRAGVGIEVSRREGAQ